jgi:hypothetical protein
MINIEALSIELQAFSTINLLQYNNDNSFIISINVGDVEKSFIDGICDSYIISELSVRIPSTIEGGIYKVSYENYGE